ncbi:hypothetical protein KJ830_03260 [bacterium]|nr:hypothetical protein [bacterium]MBU4510048.1 hypothetical protein [bacterium]
MFYVFLVDGNVESQVVIQEEIKARRIVIVNDAGQEVVELSTDVENNGGVVILNKSGNNVVIMGAYEYGGIMSVYNKDGKTHAVMGATENGGAMTVINKDDNAVAGMIVGENDNGEIGVWNKSGKRIGSLP